MKLNSCTSIELKDRRLLHIKALAGLADRIGKIDDILADRNFNRCKTEDSQPVLLSAQGNRQGRQTVQRPSSPAGCMCG